MCGIFGAWNVPHAAQLVAIGLHGIQHRAIDYAGIVSTDGRYLYRQCGSGLSRQVFQNGVLKRLHGDHALGHIRYPTVDDDPDRDNMQPVVGNYRGVEFAIAHNGNLTNVDELKRECPTRKTSMDTEFIVRLLERAQAGSLEKDLVSALFRLKGSFALGILFPDALIAINDPHGNRPLVIGRREESFFVSSETCAFPNIGAEVYMHVEAGMIVRIDSRGVSKVSYASTTAKKCPFEAIYFAHPSSEVYDVPVMTFREQLGTELERECPAVGAHIVVPIPDSAEFHARGYASSGRSGVYAKAILRSHYVGRSFIAATQAQRDEEVAGKFAFTPSLIHGKKIVLIDDSIVRGTTLPKIIAVLRSLKAAEVHVRIACPPLKYLCQYGIYMRGKDGRLIAAEQSVESIRRRMNADTLSFLPIEALKRVWPDSDGSCFACMTGEYW